MLKRLADGLEMQLRLGFIPKKQQTVRITQKKNTASAYAKKQCPTRLPSVYKPFSLSSHVNLLLVLINTYPIFH